RPVPRLNVSPRSAVSAGVVTLFAGALVLLAVLQQGEATAEVDLDDSGVWVTKTSAGLLGRFNTEAEALDGTLLAGSSTFDVQQAAYRVLMTDPGAAAANPVDPAHLALDGTMTVPAGSVVASGGSTTAGLDPDVGRLWVRPLSRAPQCGEADPRPTADVAPQGRRVTVPTTTAGVAGEPTEAELPVAEDAEVDLTAVGDGPVVLDRTAGALVLPGGRVVDLADAASARLQQPSGAADAVVV